MFNQTVLEFVNEYIRELGGPGSGYHGHRGRPGHEGGSSPSGGSSNKTASDVYERIPGSSEHYARVTDKIKKVAKRHKFPIDRIVATEEEGYKFKVGDKEFTAGGDYNPKTGTIRLFDVDQESDDHISGILAHEITHDKYHRYKKAYAEQWDEINALAAAEPDWKKWPIRASGEVREGLEEKFWAYNIKQTYFTGDAWNILKAQDGVTSYSTAYWDHARETGQSSDYDLAVNETLAEIARVGGRPSSRLWAGLYREIKNVP